MMAEGMPMREAGFGSAAVLGLAALRPKEGWAHVGCPTCGFVTTVPLDRTAPGPWCVHNGSTYVWADPHPDTQAGPYAWTRMVRVAIRARAILEDNGRG